MSASEPEGMALVTSASEASARCVQQPRLTPLAACAENALVSGPILPALLRLTLPDLAGMLVVALVAIVETV